MPRFALRCLHALLASLIGTAASAAPGALHSAPAADTDARAIDAAAADAVRQSAGHRLVILGDLHGTREIPILTGDVVARVSRRSPVTLALEMPQDEQAALIAALATPDAVTARASLLARSWWRRSNNQHDGRRSLDMLDLIERIRQLKHAGRDVALLAYDVSENEMSSDPSWRDAVMAKRVRQAYLAQPHRRVVMLTGNFHAFLRMPSYMAAPAAITTAGMQLADLKPASLRIGAATGQSWMCVNKACKPAPVRPAGVPVEGEYTGAINVPALHVGRLVTAPTP